MFITKLYKIFSHLKTFCLYLFHIIFLSYFKSNIRETWRVILVSEADIFLSESLRILAEHIATALNAKNNLFFLILIYVAFGMSQAIFLYTGFMDGISRNLDEAAIIDGCNNWQLLWKILFPVCKPIIATEAIFVFIYGYSELVFSMILMTDTKYFTVSRAMLNFSSAHTQEIGSQFAYVVMSVIPMLIIYIVFHKQIEKGMLSGAIKG